MINKFGPIYIVKSVTKIDKIENFGIPVNKLKVIKNIAS